MHEPCQHESDITIIKNDLADVKKDVKALLKFKWQIMGGAGAIGTLAAFAISLLTLFR